jgi:hypothetical protein
MTVPPLQTSFKAMKSSTTQNQAGTRSLVRIGLHQKAAAPNRAAIVVSHLGERPFTELMLHPEKLAVVLDTLKAGRRTARQPRRK